MPENLYITASCKIINNAIVKNGTILFESKVPGIQNFLISAYQLLDIKYPKFYKMDNLSKLGWLAAETLLQDDFVKQNYPSGEMGLILANSSSSLDTDIKYFESTKSIASPSLFVYTLPNIMTGEICIRHNFKGETAFFIFENFNADFMWRYVNNLINNNILQACICGWVELFEDKYKAILTLVEKRSHLDDGQLQIPANLFTTENLVKIYQ